MKVKYIAALSVASMMGMVMLGACSQPGAETQAPGAETQADPCAANPCAAKSEDPCASANPCAAKSEDPCASANPCAAVN